LSKTTSFRCSKKYFFALCKAAKRFKGCEIEKMVVFVRAHSKNALRCFGNKIMVATFYVDTSLYHTCTATQKQNMAQFGLQPLLLCYTKNRKVLNEF